MRDNDTRDNIVTHTTEGNPPMSRLTSHHPGGVEILPAQGVQ